MRRADGFLDVPGCVGGGEERRFELRRREIDALVQHPVEKPGETGAVRAHGIAQVRYLLVCEVAAKHRSDRCICLEQSNAHVNLQASVPLKEISSQIGLEWI